MRVIGTVMCALAALALVAGPAPAQTPNINLIPELKSKTQEEKEQDEIRDKAYRDSLKKIPDAKVSNDPWGGVRNADTAKPATAAKPKARTGATSN